jgi:Zn-dependent peptidase ImmA (M78 family)
MIKTQPKYSFNLSSEITREISEIAEDYAEEYCSQSETILPHLIADGLKLKWSANNFGSAFEGLLEYKNGQFHVFINIHEDEHIYTPRVRFSFGHELGHYIIDNHRNTLKQADVAPHGSISFVSDLRIEREADLFASCLLMPEKRIRKDVYRQKFNFALIDMISKKYQVSITAALLRFIALGNHPIMVVCSRNGKVLWTRFNSDFPFYQLYSAADKQLPENTCASEYFRDKTKYTRTETVFADDWFVLQNSADRRRPFFEHCIYMERLNQVVSVLWEL